MFFIEISLNDFYTQISDFSHAKKTNLQFQSLLVKEHVFNMLLKYISINYVNNASVFWSSTTNDVKSHYAFWSNIYNNSIIFMYSQ